MIRGVIVVAHPDDDALFAGPFQIAHSWITWRVICATYSHHDARARELAHWQSQLNCKDVHFLDLPDDPSDLGRNSSSFSEAELTARLQPLLDAPDVIVTHGLTGEYGHPHHITVNKVVRELCPSVPTVLFAHYAPVDSFTITVPDFYDRCVKSYPSQAKVIRALHNEISCCSVGRYSLTTSSRSPTTRR